MHTEYKPYTMLKSIAQNFVIEAERGVMTRRELRVATCELYASIAQMADALTFAGDSALAAQYRKAAAWMQRNIIEAR